MNLASFIQAVRGPLLLITLGVLMVIDYHTPFSFSRTWPALIIVFGLLKLLERVTAPPAAPVYPPPMPPGYMPQAGPYPQSAYPPQGAYQGPGSYPGSVYQPAAGYQPPPPPASGGTPQ